MHILFGFFSWKDQTICVIGIKQEQVSLYHACTCFAAYPPETVLPGRCYTCYKFHFFFTRSAYEVSSYRGFLPYSQMLYWCQKCSRFCNNVGAMLLSAKQVGKDQAQHCLIRANVWSFDLYHSHGVTSFTFCAFTTVAFYAENGPGIKYL